ncbi:PREDICTED: 5-methylcytosine rRNA methyltransferase NSUN4-like, partial [Rhagoletis zephyria]|uniref:5-methylcytosine rRNA methyltransferase NSUN4-like n=1 Tax=Rhagoletis zephyria TaxID=28612 RepID=UPI0008115EA0
HRKQLKKESVDLALAHYDNFYSKVYQEQWQSIRLGLLSPNKYAAIVNHFGDSEAVQIALRQAGAYDLQYIYEKNLRRILRQLEKKRFFAARKAEKRRGDAEEGRAEMSSDDEHVHPSILEASGATSDSEFESINAFFTDSEGGGEDGGGFINEAQMDLNLNDYVPVSDLKYAEETVDDADYFKFYDIHSEVPVTVVEQNVLRYPTNLSLFTFPRNNFSTFPSPKLRQTNLFDYYLIDAASALPALLLDIQDGDYVADFCAAPGGKSLLLYLMLKDCRFFLNEKSLSRFKRLQNVFASFVPRSSQANIEFCNCDANSLRISKPNTFDRILVDAPCSNDRHSLYVNDNNIFAPKRINERIGLPSQQMDLLLSALYAVRPGGTVVYSTCSLSPIQNDGVVHMALQRLAQEGSTSTFSVVNLKEALRPLRGVFALNHSFKYGTQVVPFLPSNFGPMYFAKLVRTA